MANAKKSKAKSKVGTKSKAAPKVKSKAAPKVKSKAAAKSKPVATKAKAGKKTKSAGSTKPKAKKLTIDASYHHFYVHDETCTADLGSAFNQKSIAERLMIGDGIIGVGTAREAEVPVTVEVLAAAPALDPKAQHVTECSVPAPSGKLLVGGPTDYLPDIARFAVPKGTVTVRVSHYGLDTISEDEFDGDDHYRVAIWPAKPGAARVVKQWNAG